MTTADSLRVVVVDDEPLARAVVREYIGAHPGVEIVAECANGFEAVKAVSELSPDLMFLDVQMPKLSGFEVLELIGRSVPVIFTTAYDQYADDQVRNVSKRTTGKVLPSRTTPSLGNTSFSTRAASSGTSTSIGAVQGTRVALWTSSRVLFRSFKSALVTLRAP